jgi:hypothetical protein
MSSSDISSPILIFGDVYVSKNHIVSAKKKYSNIQWVTKSTSDDSLDDIEMEAYCPSWNDSEKIILIQDLPNRKNVREFLVKLSKSCPSYTKLIIWDSNGHIKNDKETGSIEKTWIEFVDSFKKIKGSKIINNGEELNEKTEKNNGDCSAFISKCFAKYGKTIDNKEIKLLISIVGYDRGMLSSDIAKMCLTCPDKVTSQFIIDNAFPVTEEAILYKLGNSVDEGNYENILNMMDKFLASGMNSNVMAEVFIKKARWQMIVAYLWNQGMSWFDIPNKLMEMGKFPSSIWHNQEIESYRKKSESEALQDKDSIKIYLNRKEGIPIKYFKISDKEETKAKSKKKNSETMPMYFMASQTTEFVKNIVSKNSNMSNDELKKKVIKRSLYVYNFMQDKLAEIRYGNNPLQNAQEMAYVLAYINLDNF